MNTKSLLKRKTFGSLVFQTFFPKKRETKINRKSDDEGNNGHLSSGSLSRVNLIQQGKKIPL